VISLSRLRDWSLLIICNLIWASYFVVVKLVQREVGPIFATSFPIAAATILLIPIVRRESLKSGKSRIRMPRQDIVAFILIGVFGQVLAQLFGTWGTRLSPASNAALINFTLPVVTAIMAYIFLRERLNFVTWVSFVFAILGVLECSEIDWRTVSVRSHELILANAMLFISIAGSAFYNVYSKKLLIAYSPMQVLLYSYYVLISLLLPITMYLEPAGFTGILRYSTVVWIGFGILVVFQYGIAPIIFLNVLSRIDATQAALSNYMIPFFGVVIASIVLHERLTRPMIIGGSLVLMSTFLATGWQERRRPEITVCAASAIPPEGE
jgi:drug/metabolite transporter (DMT)-like permease